MRGVAGVATREDEEVVAEQREANLFTGKSVSGNIVSALSIGLVFTIEVVGT